MSYTTGIGVRYESSDLALMKFYAQPTLYTRVKIRQKKILNTYLGKDGAKVAAPVPRENNAALAALACALPAGELNTETHA
jgi:Ser/Thr protein kinase RdoA (MazF antagonist)